MDFKLEDVVWPKTPFNLMDSAVLIGNRGSVAHGTYIPNSNPNSIDDIDIMAIVIPPKEYYLGLSKWEATTEINDPWDVLIYEYRKFLNLLTKQNPNVLMMLWLEKEDYYYISDEGQRLIDNRDLFASKDCAKTFIGYAQGQLNKMTHVAGEGYLGEKRKQLVAKYGYDTKNAAHAIRLLHMGIEFLATGQLKVKRTEDRQLLVDIKTGKYTLDFVLKLVTDSMDQIRFAEENSPLPDKLHMEAIDFLCVQSVTEHLGLYD